MHLKKQYLSFSISCTSLHYCISPKPREHLYESHSLLIWKQHYPVQKNPRALLESTMKVTVQLEKRHSLHETLLRPWPIVQSFRCLFVVAPCGKEKKHRETQSQYEEHCINEVPLKSPCPQLLNSYLMVFLFSSVPWELKDTS